MITILCGKSASGKDTLLNELVKSGEFESLISTTSRPMRDGETDGKEYHFVSREEFEKRLAEGKFIEHRSYNTLVGGNPDTWYYGMEKRDLDPNKNYLVILDLEGAKAFQQVYGKDNTLAVFVEAPDAIRTDRAMSRGSFDESEWERRLADDNIKFSEENVFEVCDTNVLNYGSDLGKLVRDFKDTFEREMLKKYLMSNDVYIGVTMGKTGFEDCFATDMNPDKGGNIRYFKQYPDSIRVGDYEYEDGTVAISMPDNEELFKEVKDRVTGYYGEDNIYTLFLNDFEIAQGWGDHSVLKDDASKDFKVIADVLKDISDMAEYLKDEEVPLGIATDLAEMSDNLRSYVDLAQREFDGKPFHLQSVQMNINRLYNFINAHNLNGDKDMQSICKSDIAENKNKNQGVVKE